MESTEAAARATLTKIKKQISAELSAVISEHHTCLQEQLSETLNRYDAVLESAAAGGDPQQGAVPERRADLAAAFRSNDSAASSCAPSPRLREKYGSVGRGGGLMSENSDESNFSSHMLMRRKKLMRMSEKFGAINSSFTIESYAKKASCGSRVRDVMQSAVCNNLFSLVILVYVIAMGLEVEATASSAMKSAAIILQTTCNILFTVEMCLRLYGLGRDFFCGEDLLWNLLDVAFVLMFVLEIVVMGVNNTIHVSTINNLMMFRLVRLVRVVRILRVIRVVRKFQPLRVLVRSIGATLKGLMYALLLLLMVIYTFGVVFTMAAKESGADSASSRLGQYYGSLARSALTLFQSVTSGVDWEHVYQPLHDEHWLYGALFILYFVFAFFAVLNVMTALFCQSAIESVKKDDEEIISQQLANKSLYVHKLKQLFRTFDTESTAEDIFTLATFEQNMKNERIKAYFHSLDIKIADARKLFYRLLEDDDSGNVAVDMDSFIEGCLELKGPATTMDLRDLSCEVRWLARRMDRKFAQLSENQGATRAHVVQLGRMVRDVGADRYGLVDL